MPAPRMSMRKIREILRLRWGQGLPSRAVAQSVRCSPSTVSDCVGRAQIAGLSWPLPEELDDEQLETRLYPERGSSHARPEPDFQHIHRELRRRGVTLQLLWQDYRAVHPEEGLGYSSFCERYRRWRGELDLVMRQTHAPGEKLFVDYAGMTIPITNPTTGEVTQASVFVATLGASQYIYAEAVAGEDLASWTSAHIRCCEELGGSPAAWVPDNLKAAVTKPCFYDPDVNPTYGDLAEHYGAVVIPTRVRKPRDKAKVENAVLQVERWVLAPLRNQIFFSMEEANHAMRERRQALNDKPLKKIDLSRRQLFDEMDRPALKPLPSRRFERAERKLGVTVHIDYHIEFDGHYYSVPFALSRKKVDVRATTSTIEVFHNRKRVASHRRSGQRGRHTTIPEHRPKAHREYAEWTPSRLVRWAGTVGPKTAEVAQAILDSRRHPEQGYRSCLGLMRLGKRYSSERLELASARALALRSPSYRTIYSMLKAGLESQPLPSESRHTPVEHDNVRGPTYYH